MKKIIILSLITLLFSANSYPEKYESKSAKITSKTSLTLRELPDKNSKKIMVIPSGETIAIIEEDSADATIDGIKSKWYKILYKNKTGWLFGGYLAMTNDTKSSVFEDNIFCYKNTKGSLIIAGTSGEKQTAAIKFLDGYSGRISMGDTIPKLSPDKRLLSYLDKKEMINLYDIKKKNNLSLKASIPGQNGFPATEILITGWTKNFLVFHISKYVSEEDSDPGETWDGEGFYIYSINDGKIKKHPGIKYVVSLVQSSDEIIVLNKPDSENNLSIYNITSETSEDFITIPNRYSQFNAADRNNFTYISHEKISEDFDASVVFRTTSDGVVKKIVTGDWAEYQFPQFFYNNQFIVYSHLYRQNEGDGFTYKEYISLYDLKNSRNKELFKTDKRIVSGHYIIFKDGKSLFSYDVLTDKKILIASDVSELYD